MSVDPGDGAQPLNRQEVLTVLLESLEDYFTSVHQTLGAGQAMARLLGEDHLVVFTQMLTEHQRHDRTVRLAHRALYTTASARGDGDIC